MLTMFLCGNTLIFAVGISISIRIVLTLSSITLMPVWPYLTRLLSGLAYIDRVGLVKPHLKKSQVNNLHFKKIKVPHHKVRNLYEAKVPHHPKGKQERVHYIAINTT